MPPHEKANHSLFFALAAFILLVLLGSQADVGERNSATVVSSLFGSATTVATPLAAVTDIGDWESVGALDPVQAVSESTCDAEQTYIQPTSFSDSEASFSVNIVGVPDGAKITSVSIAPCLSSWGGGASSDVVFSYNFAGYEYLFKPVSGVSSSYVLSGGVYAQPALGKTTTFSIPSIEKTAATVLLVGVSAPRNGGGIRVSNIKVSVEYIAPSPAGEPFTQKPDFSVRLEKTEDVANTYFEDAVLEWSSTVAKKGGQIEMNRANASGDLLGSWQMVGLVSDSATTFRYPIVIGGIPRDDYASGINYLFRIRYNTPGAGLVQYSDQVSVTPEENLTSLSPLGVTVSTNASAKRIELSWKDPMPTDMSHWFIIERAILGSSLLWQEVGKTEPLVTSWNDHGPFESANYFYRVRLARPASDGVGILLSPYSEIMGTIWH